jgi:hypothetical protein
VADAVELVDRYWIALDGDQQVPPVHTKALGYVGLKFEDDSTKPLYNVNLANIHEFTAQVLNCTSDFCKSFVSLYVTSQFLDYLFYIYSDIFFC